VSTHIGVPEYEIYKDSTETAKSSEPLHNRASSALPFHAQAQAQAQARQQAQQQAQAQAQLSGVAAMGSWVGIEMSDAAAARRPDLQPGIWLSSSTLHDFANFSRKQGQAIFGMSARSKSAREQRKGSLILGYVNTVTPPKGNDFSGVCSIEGSEDEQQEQEQEQGAAAGGSAAGGSAAGGSAGQAIDLTGSLTGTHWVMVAVVWDGNNNAIGVQLDPMDPDGLLAGAYPTAIQYVKAWDVQRWVLNWSEAMPLLFQCATDLIGPTPTLQHDMVDCGVWVSMLIYVVCCVRGGKVSVKAALKAVQELDGNVCKFRQVMACVCP
jgi:hypothetical protein